MDNTNSPAVQRLTGLRFLADVMSLGETVQFEVWFLPTNRDGYSPRMLTDGLASIESAQAFISATAGRYHGTLEVVRITTRRGAVHAAQPVSSPTRN